MNSKRGNGRSILLAAALATVITATAGCSSDTIKGSKVKEGEPEVRSAEQALKTTKNISSSILDMANIKAKVTEPGPGTAVCESIDPDFTEYYLVRHPWSIYDASNTLLKKAMQNIREKLPEHGWIITKDGPASSSDEDPEILAKNQTKKHHLHVIWHRESTSKEPLIAVTLTSSCFKSPEGGEVQ